MNKTVRDAIHRVFKGEPPEHFEFMGVECYNPQDVGAALGYGNDGWDIMPWLKGLTAAVELTQEWPLGHLVRLGGRPGAPVVLTECGLFRVLMLCPKSKAAEFRDWLDEELAGGK